MEKKKLTLKKEVIASLENEQMKQIYGGVATFNEDSCNAVCGTAITEPVCQVTKGWQCEPATKNNLCNNNESIVCPVYSIGLELSCEMSAYYIQGRRCPIAETEIC